MTRREHEQCRYCDAVEAFETWVAKHDPNGDMTMLEQVEAYYAALAEYPPTGDIDNG